MVVAYHATAAAHPHHVANAAAIAAVAVTMQRKHHCSRGNSLLFPNSPVVKF